MWVQISRGTVLTVQFELTQTKSVFPCVSDGVKYIEWVYDEVVSWRVLIFFLIGDVENRARTLFTIAPSVKCRVWFDRGHPTRKVLLATADQPLSGLAIWSHDYSARVSLHFQMLSFAFVFICILTFKIRPRGDFVLEKQNKDGTWPRKWTRKWTLFGQREKKANSYHSLHAGIFFLWSQFDMFKDCFFSRATLLIFLFQVCIIFWWLILHNINCTLQGNFMHIICSHGCYIGHASPEQHRYTCFLDYIMEVWMHILHSVWLNILMY